jgi:hypothetical protein
MTIISSPSPARAFDACYKVAENVSAGHRDGYGPTQTSGDLLYCMQAVREGP